MSEEKFSMETIPEGIRNLAEGYIDYAEEVIVRRALPDLRDGMKPVNRRILYTLKKTAKGNSRVKCSDLAGSTLKLHPHGDNSVYQAMVLMTDSNGTMSIPVLTGQGNFGGVHTTDPAAAPRYTEVSLGENAEQYFGEMEGINMIPNYDSSTVEPEVLPVSYPAVLCNSTSGIAVGFRSNIPSFNFNDVIDLTVEYLEKGKCTSVICPDFVTGGYYIRNNKELDKLMKTGTAKLKLRGRCEVTGKEIKVVEFPFGKTIQGLLDQIQKSNIAGIRDAGNVDDYEHGVGLLIDCSSKNRVDEVILSLYRDTDLQCYFSADMMTILNGKPVRKGVYSIIEEWVKWRREVLTKEYNTCIAGWKEKIRESRAFLEILKDREKCDKVTDLILHTGDAEAVKYILDNFDREIIDESLAKWIVSRRINAFRTGGKYREQYDALKASIEEYEGYLKDIDAVIIRQLKALKAKEGSKYPRKTEITTTDYDFQAPEEVEVAKDDNPCTYVFSKNFLKKLRGTLDIKPEAGDQIIYATASDILVAVDNRGRVLRVYCEDLPYNGISELGVYLPRYFDLQEGEDYRMWLTVLDGTTKMIVYTDGNIGYLDTSEWFGQKRKVRVLEKGVCTAVADKIGCLIDEPEALYVIDSKGQFGLCVNSSIKHKDRTAKTRVFNLNKGASLVGCYPCTELESALVIPDGSVTCSSRLSPLKSVESLQVSLEEFIEF